MKKFIRTRAILLAGIILVLLLTGCQNQSDNPQNEPSQQSQAERQHESQLEQNDIAEGEDIFSSTSPAANDTPKNPDQATTHTLEELTAMVDAFVQKANEAKPVGNSSDAEVFVSLKQEEERIDRILDIHEDELERLYRQNVLSKDEYKSREQKLESLEDKLDNAEDRLERVFGMDD